MRTEYPNLEIRHCSNFKTGPCYRIIAEFRSSNQPKPGDPDYYNIEQDHYYVFERYDGKTFALSEASLSMMRGASYYSPSFCSYSVINYYKESSIKDYKVNQVYLEEVFLPKFGPTKTLFPSILLQRAEIHINMSETELRNMYSKLKMIGVECGFPDINTILIYDKSRHILVIYTMQPGLNPYEIV
jgi:hypothetical protein